MRETMSDKNNIGTVNGEVVEVTVDNVSDLSKAVKDKVPRIIVTGKLAKKLKPLTKVKVNNASLSYGMSRTGLVSACKGIPPIVLVTLIMTIGMVTIVGLFLGYTIKISGQNVEWNKK